MSTIRDVAKKAGVGVATVSRYIAGKGPVSDKTAKKLKKAIALLDYRPSHAARSLPSGRTQTIGVYMPVIHGEFYAPMLNSICMALRNSNLRMMVAIGSDYRQEREEVLQGARFLSEHGCDGLVVMGTALTEQDVNDMLGAHEHVVLLNRTVQSFRNRCFAPNHREAGRLAAATLWEAGHRQIAAIEGITDSGDNVARMRGFLNELGRRGADLSRIPVLSGYFSPDGGRVAAKILLDQYRDFTAIFCASDESATGTLSHLHQAGVSVPGDVSVMGYDGLELSAYTAPPLTTVRIPWDEICVSAVHCLANGRYGLDLPVKRSFAPEVMWRASVKMIGRAPDTSHKED